MSVPDVTHNRVCIEPAFARCLIATDHSTLLVRARCGTATEWAEIEVRDFAEMAGTLPRQIDRVAA